VVARGGLVAVVAVARVAAAEPAPAELHFPRGVHAIVQLVALPDGGAVGVQDGTDPPVLLAADGTVHLLSRPAVGPRAHAAVRNGVVWLVGDDAVAHARLAAHGTGAWTVVPTGVAQVRATAIVTLPDAVVAVVANDAATDVLTFDSAVAPPARAQLGAGYTHAVGDGAGGAWVVAPGIGVAHLVDGAWTTMAVPAVGRRIAADARGGAYVLVGADRVDIAADGTTRVITAGLADDPAAGALFGCAALDRDRDELVVSPRARRDRLVRVARDGATADDALPITAAGADRCALAVGGGATWLWLSSGEMLRGAAGAWTVYRPAPEVISRRPPDEAPGDNVPAALAVDAALVLAGGAAASELHGDPASLPAVQLGGEAIAMGGVALVSLIATLADPHHDELPLYAGAVALPLVVPVGAWAAGELERPSRHPVEALGGAALGEAIGALAGHLVGTMLEHAFHRPPNRWDVVVGGGLAGAMVGYQAGGGGPKRTR
jgi:hypothetical protein